MARLPRLAVGEHLHLLIQRGHNGLPVFADAQDRVVYLQCLAEAAREHAVAVHAYALPPTEVLLLATPARGESLGRMMQAVSRRFVRAYNLRHRRDGTLWAGRFASTVVDPVAHGLASLLWVNAGGPGQDVAAAPHPADASASSALHHAGAQRVAWLVDPAFYWQLGNTPFEREARYRAAAADGLTTRERILLRQSASTGWVLGAPGFAGELAARAQRRTAPLPRGRPRKSAVE